MLEEETKPMALVEVSTQADEAIAPPAVAEISEPIESLFENPQLADDPGRQTARFDEESHTEYHHSATAVEELVEEQAATPPAAEPLVSLAASNRKHKNKCAVCHAAIVAGEEMTACPDCAMIFHVECWEENYGCSSYGCPQVNCLAAGEAETILDYPAIADPATLDEPRSSLPWELIILAASVVGTLLGALAFGIPAAVVALIAFVVLIVKKPQRTFLLAAAIVICLIGIAGGLLVSDFWYFSARHVPAALLRRLGGA